MRAVTLHLRTTPARWAVLPLAALGLAILFGRSRYWIGIWPEAGAAAQITGYFLSLFAAGVSAWIAAQVTVRGMREQLAAAARRSIGVETGRLAAAAAWIVMAYLVVAVAAFAATARTFPPGVGAFFSYLLLGLVPVLASTAWGWLVGRLLAPMLAAVCALMGWFVLTSLLGQFAQSLRISGPPWLALDLTTILLRLAAVIVLAAGVCVIPLTYRGRTVVRGLAGPLGVALVVVVHVNTTLVTYRQPASDPLCVQGAIEYCLWPEHEKYIPLVKAADARVAALPADLPLPPRVVDYALSGSTVYVDLTHSIERQGDFPHEFDISEGSRWGLARGIATAISREIFKSCAVQAKPDPERRRDQIFAWLEWRIAGGGSPDYTTDAPGEMQDAWTVGRQTATRSEPEQAEWVNRTISEVKTLHCHEQ